MSHVPAGAGEQPGLLLFVEHAMARRSLWRLIRSGALPGPLNMGLDEALLESVAQDRSPPVLRLYRWELPTVSIGYFQNGSGVVNLRSCAEMGLEVVRRITGGRAVLHEREVTYAVISPERNALFPGGILENYRVIARTLQAALASFGIEAELACGRSRGAGGAGAQRSACFTAPGTYELIFRGRKVAGSAQRRRGKAFLQHGSIPLDLDSERLFRALNTVPSVPVSEGARFLEESVGWLNRWLATPVSVDEVEDRLVAAWAARGGVDWGPDQPSQLEWERARELAAEKYANPSWNHERIK